MKRVRLAKIVSEETPESDINLGVIKSTVRDFIND